ncbi:FtsX-like permease family protein [Streptomyces sp. NPDC088354]|uniref:FtsX-like permease family protein n=1 Tax=unclassified Streptomyces TaxID=2593676 RepID=UPI0029AF546E|nr:FtsX-like permease family protein [Streptomyces sp. MI02-7b]MDX3074551.1 ABC transporter permease [Streptomyces sp. MI02-7b]
MTALRADARLAWSLLRGSPNGEWWRLGLTAASTALGTLFALAATVVAVIGTRFGGGAHWYSHQLFNDRTTRSGLVIGLLLLIVPLLAFLGQCTRIGAVQLEQRLAALRLAGATPRQVRRIQALETGTACGIGALAGLAAFLVLRAVLGALHPVTVPDGGPLGLTAWPADVPVPWVAAAAVVFGMPLIATLEARFTLRRAAADPLGVASGGRRPYPRPGRGRLALWALAPLALVAATGLQVANMFVLGGRSSVYGVSAPVSLAAVVLSLVGVLYGSAGLALLTGRLAARSGRPALLIAGERLQADPWAATRSHGAVLLAVLAGVGFMGVRRLMIEDLAAPYRLPYSAEDLDYYFDGLRAVGAGIVIAFAVAVGGLVVAAVESLITRRRTLAALAAGGVPRGVLNRAALLETALPLVPAAVLATGCGLLAVGSWWKAAGLDSSYAFPLLEPLLAAVALPAAALLATAASLPLLRRTVHPAQLRFE